MEKKGVEQQEVEQRKKIVTELSTLLAYDQEQFRSYCVDKNVGYLLGLANYLTIIYNRTVDIKREIVEKVKSNEIEMNDEVQQTITELFAYLMKIEERIFITRELINERINAPLVLPNVLN